MFFNSISFFVFLFITFLLFWKISGFSSWWGKVVLLISSYVFYGWWDWRFLILIIISSATDFFIGQLIFKSADKKRRKMLLLISIFVNIGILFVFKYFNFFIDSIQSLIGVFTTESHWSTLQIILPVGISFYTFQTLSYTIDIYKRKIEPTNSALTFFTFVAFFPQLVAGPIERAAKLIPQFEKKPVFSYSQATSGLKLILWGLFKKMVIADQLSVIVDSVYANPNSFTGWGVVFATFLFGFQIYSDFSGYSDIAIGTARLFSIELMINFRTPYFANSFHNFWHRWHISLSTWFRDYVYIPMGGSKGNHHKRNILITFLVSGLWHGANITFVLWGGIHGLFYIIEQQVSRLIHINKGVKSVFGFILTFILVNLSWLFFRAESLTHLQNLTATIFSADAENLTGFLRLIFENGNFTEQGRVLVFVFPVFIIIELFIGERTFADLLENSPKPVRWSFYYVVFMAILFFGVIDAAPSFIYFQF